MESPGTRRNENYQGEDLHKMLMDLIENEETINSELRSICDLREKFHKFIRTIARTKETDFLYGILTNQSFSGYLASWTNKKMPGISTLHKWTKLQEAQYIIDEQEKTICSQKSKICEMINCHQIILHIAAKEKSLGPHIQEMCANSEIHPSEVKMSNGASKIKNMNVHETSEIENLRLMLAEKTIELEQLKKGRITYAINAKTVNFGSQNIVRCHKGSTTSSPSRTTTTSSSISSKRLTIRTHVLDKGAHEMQLLKMRDTEKWTQHAQPMSGYTTECNIHNHVQEIHQNDKEPVQNKVNECNKEEEIEFTACRPTDEDRHSPYLSNTCEGNCQSVEHTHLKSVYEHTREAEMETMTNDDLSNHKQPIHSHSRNEDSDQTYQREVYSRVDNLEQLQNLNDGIVGPAPSPEHIAEVSGEFSTSTPSENRGRNVKPLSIGKLYEGFSAYQAVRETFDVSNPPKEFLKIVANIMATCGPKLKLILEDLGCSLLEIPQEVQMSGEETVVSFALNEWCRRQSDPNGTGTSLSVAMRSLLDKFTST